MCPFCALGLSVRNGVERLWGRPRTFYIATTTDRRSERKDQLSM
jgi:hypothetical protein